MAKVIMVQGTMSNSGKSFLVAGLCRIFRQDGYRVAPFKSQNMALNSYITDEGLEMGRAQVMQAEAAGIKPMVCMNPILLKPTNNTGSQVIVNGRVLKNMPAREYFAYKKTLIPDIKKAFKKLEEYADIIVIEGAGSPAEINLKENDIVNMGLAYMVDAPVLLVGDIDRGGVFAQLLGTLMLLTDEEKNRVCGLIINKFRGDIRLFEPGIKMLEDLCGIPVVGVVPYYRDIYIEEEDSLALATKSVQAEQGKVNIAVILLRHLSNFTDFNVLERDPRVHLFYTNNTDEIAKADIILLPGSKRTLADLHELRRNGVAQAVIRAHREGATVMGICGGYQLMGQEVCDPDHVEGEIERLPGLGLLPVSTHMTGEKVTRQVKFQLTIDNGQLLKGYEIHMGTTIPTHDVPVSPLNLLEDGRTDGYYVNRTCMGTYIHGILDNPAFIDFLLEPFADKLADTGTAFDYQQFKEEQYDKLADHVRRHINLPLIYQILTTHD